MTAARIPGGQARGPVRTPAFSGLRTMTSVDPAVRCVASRRHLLEEGVTYEEVVNGAKVWVARLVCVRCGTVRITMFELHAGWVALSKHTYFRPADYRDLTANVSPDEARARTLNALWKKKGSS